MPEPPFESAQSSDMLFAAVYDRLKAMAGRQLASAARSTTLDTTALVHELYLRVNAQGEQSGRFPHKQLVHEFAFRCLVPARFRLPP